MKSYLSTDGRRILGVSGKFRASENKDPTVSDFHAFQQASRCAGSALMGQRLD